MEKRKYLQPQVAITSLDATAYLLPESLHNMYSDQNAYSKHRGIKDEDSDNELINW